MVKGIVEAISGKGNAAKVGGAWYSNGRFQVMCSKGDTVEIDYEQNGNWNNIKSLKVLEKGSGEQGSTDLVDSKDTYKSFDADRQALICRQNALTNAVAFFSSKEAEVTDVIEVAKIFSNWTING